MNLNANKTVENFQIIDDVVLYDFMNQYSNVHFENQEAGFVVPYAQIQKSYKTFVNSQMENDKYCKLISTLNTKMQVLNTKNTFLAI